ncbi:MAG: ABC transporter ATP-binding protein [Sporichthyaceae bacterium]|nr:ABC transporter ATP-binding protein [Sporichthyaceae bacterium]
MRFGVAAGEVVAILGPNGAGKSTALRALAGLLPLHRGHVRLDGAVLDDAAAGVRLPPERRPVGLVFQDYLLFPHLSARENVAFGLRARGVGRAAAGARADVALAGVGLADVGDRKPRQLSGGEAQRVALARVLVTEPRLVLLDEPLAALDAGSRLQVRADLRRQLAGFGGATVLVTHDALDAFVLADRLVVLEEGAVVQAGTPTEVARRPRTDYVARLVGLNLYRGVAHGTSVTLDTGAVVASAHHATGRVLVAFPPAAVTVHREQPHGSARNAWPVTVVRQEQHADTVRVWLTGPLDVAADLTPLSVGELRLEPGAEVWAAVKAMETMVYPS